MIDLKMSDLFGLKSKLNYQTALKSNVGKLKILYTVLRVFRRIISLNNKTKLDE